MTVHTGRDRKVRPVAPPAPEPAPLVTVIVPNYNYGDVLPLCLDAVFAQTYAPLEVVVADDCSTDGSAAVATARGARVVRTAVNSGAAVARSVGAAAANGEILFFVDSDVALAPDAVANAVAVLAGDADIGAVCGIYDPEPLVGNSPVEAYRALQHHYWTASSTGDVSFLWSAMFALRAEVFAEVGSFNSRLRHVEEVDYGDRLARRYRLVSTPAIHGRASHDRFFGLLRKLFLRCRFRVPLYARRQRFAQGYETPARAVAAVAALGAAAAVPLPLLLGPLWWAAPAVLLAGSLACDTGMYRFVLRRRGPAFTAFYLGMHFLVNLVIASAVAAGVLQWLVSRRFRHIYDMPETGAAAPAAAAPPAAARQGSAR